MQAAAADITRKLNKWGEGKSIEWKLNIYFSPLMHRARMKELNSLTATPTQSRRT